MVLVTVDLTALLLPQLLVVTDTTTMDTEGNSILAKWLFIRRLRQLNLFLVWFLILLLICDCGLCL